MSLLSFWWVCLIELCKTEGSSTLLLSWIVVRSLTTSKDSFNTFGVFLLRNFFSASRNLKNILLLIFFDHLQSVLLGSCYILVSFIPLYYLRILSAYVFVILNNSTHVCLKIFSLLPAVLYWCIAFMWSLSVLAVSDHHSRVAPTIFVLCSDRPSPTI